jgi:N6-L-threonylcarbamoyladenine synthase
LAIKLYEESGDKCLVSAFVLNYIGRAIELTCDSFIEEYGDTPFVFAGGVMCNSIIKKRLNGRFDAAFAEPAMSADNAVGVAELARRAHLANN